jgi:hypothetical protein
VDEDARAADLDELAAKVNESLDEYAAEKNLRLQEIDESLERREEYLKTGSQAGFSDEDHLWAEQLDLNVKKLEDDERAKHVKDMRKILEAEDIAVEDGAVKQVVRDLVGAGLLRLNCDEVAPTRAALYFDRLDRI